MSVEEGGTTQYIILGKLFIHTKKWNFTLQ